ncbi:unnamed protein product [Lampetra fluviatilis]
MSAERHRLSLGGGESFVRGLASSPPSPRLPSASSMRSRRIDRERETEGEREKAGTAGARIEEQQQEEQEQQEEEQQQQEEEQEQQQ